MVKDDSTGTQIAFVPAEDSIAVDIKWKSANKETLKTFKK